MEAVELKDIVGNTYTIGDKVATDTLSYKRSHLRVGTITEVGPKGVKVYFDVSGGRAIWRKPDQVVKVFIND